MKHAYLIMAHGAFEQLKQLVSLLDDFRNDIYIHIDSKAGSFELDFFRSCAKKSQVYFIKRRSVTWGGDSQIKLEMDMLEDALKNSQYDYLHLLSGVDFPIKSKRYIFEFFENNKGVEFIMIDRKADNSIAIKRCERHYLLQNHIGRNERPILKAIQQFFLKAESIVGYSRIPKNMRKYFRKGPNWFSITGDFAQYVISQKKWIYKRFSDTICADEVFLQTLIYNSPYRDNLYINNKLKYTNLRITDWQRGNPYIWQNEDVDFLINSPYLFARKFDTVKDKYIYNRIKKL